LVNVKRVVASSFQSDKEFYNISIKYEGLQECKPFFFGALIKQKATYYVAFYL
jgi:hypothetical protein